MGQTGIRPRLGRPRQPGGHHEATLARARARCRWTRARLAGQRAARRRARFESPVVRRRGAGSRITNHGASRTTTAIAKASRKASATRAAATSSTIRTSGRGSAPTRAITAAYGDSDRYQQSFRTGLRGRLLGRLSALRARLRLPAATAGLPEHARRLRLSDRAATAIPGTKVGTAIPDQGGYGYPGTAATATARHSRTARTTATRRAARTRAIATLRSAAPQVVSRGRPRLQELSTARVSSTRTSIARGSRKATTAAIGNGATGGSSQLARG